MHVAQLEVSGFRGIRSACISLQQHTVLLGVNNVGKTAIIDALGLLLGRDRLVRNIGDYDFFGGLPTAASRISIKGTITGFATNDPSDHHEWFNAKDGGVPGWWTGREVTFGEPPRGSKLCTQIAFAARFDEETLESVPLRYFYTGAGDPFECDVSSVKTSHLKEIGFFLLPAHRTWDRVVSFASELFKRVLRVQKAMPSSTAITLREMMRNPAAKLEDDERLRGVVDRVNSELAGFVGEDEAGLVFRPTGGDIESVLQAITPHLNGRGNCKLPIGRHGSGVISLQTLLLLFEFGRARAESGENFIFAAEEPELHLHPGHHRRLVSRIRGVSAQSITTTHSPEIAAYYKPEEILILRNSDGEMQGIPLVAPGSKVPGPNALMRLFTVYRPEICEALMHRYVLLPEGLTEFRWFHSLSRLCIAASGWQLPEIADDPSTAVGVLPTQDSNVVQTFQHFHELIPLLVPLVDGDDAGDEFVSHLLKLHRPPSLILQLGQGCVLEHVIRWMILPVNAAEWKSLQMAMKLEEHTPQGLFAWLKEKKKHYLYHDAIAAYIADNQVCAQRAARFLGSLYELIASEGADSSEWLADAERSTSMTRIWRWAH